MTLPISSTTISQLANYSTATIANAIERFDVRLRNVGFTLPHLVSRTPSLTPMVGYAITVRVRTASPSAKTRDYFESTDWLSQLPRIPLPHILVVQDMDDREIRAGAFVGEVHAAILQALGCVGVATNGCVRDVKQAERRGFRMFSQGISPSHAYSHIVEIGTPVEIAGLTIANGDLLHGDSEGVLRVPHEIASRIPQMADHLIASERDLLAFCDSPDFSIEGLKQHVEQRAQKYSFPSDFPPTANR